MNKKERFLGKGLETVWELIEKVSVTTSEDLSARDLKQIPINKVIPDSKQPRRFFDTNSLQELADSVRTQGILQPILVKPKGDDYEVIAGERRLRAAQLVGLQEIPCLICEVDDKTGAIYSLLENIQRKDLNPIEEALGLKRLTDEFLLTHEQIGQALGVPRASITNTLRRLSLSTLVQDYLANKQIEIGHAKILMTLELTFQDQWAAKIIEENWSVKRTAHEIKIFRQQSKIKLSDDPQVAKLIDLFNELIKRVDDDFELKADFNLEKDGRGNIYFSFESIHDAESLVRKLERVFSSDTVTLE